jgi:hypothetical protein
MFSSPADPIIEACVHRSGALTELDKTSRTRLVSGQAQYRKQSIVDGTPGMLVWHPTYRSHLLLQAGIRALPVLAIPQFRPLSDIAALFVTS